MNDPLREISIFLREHVVGMIIFAVCTGIAGNYLYDKLKADERKPPQAEAARIVPQVAAAVTPSVQIESASCRKTNLGFEVRMAGRISGPADSQYYFHATSNPSSPLSSESLDWTSCDAWVNVGMSEGLSKYRFCKHRPSDSPHTKWASFNLYKTTPDPPPEGVAHLMEIFDGGAYKTLKQTRIPLNCV